MLALFRIAFNPLLLCWIPRAVPYVLPISTFPDTCRRWTKDVRMNPGLFTVMLVLLCAGSLGVQSRQVILPGSPSPPFNIVAANNKIVDERNKPNLLEERKDSKQYDEAALFDGLQVAGSFGYWISIISTLWNQVMTSSLRKHRDRNSVGSVEVEERTGFADLAKHLGTFVFRGVVRRVCYPHYYLFCSCTLCHVYVNLITRNVGSFSVERGKPESTNKTSSHGSWGSLFLFFFLDFFQLECDW